MNKCRHITHSNSKANAAYLNKTTSDMFQIKLDLPDNMVV